VYGRINCREQITLRSTFVWENKLQGTDHLEIYKLIAEETAGNSLLGDLYVYGRINLEVYICMGE
jgi:hypothetical protein